MAMSGDVLLFCAAASSNALAQIVLNMSPAGSPSMSATSPWTWAPGYTIAGEFTYRPA